jgi:L-cysteine:1D-myo-inositol 2-amino-2-deoxy-alpha-D-glucopyranoside ligase
MVGYDGEKMSKSKGNLVLVSKLREAGYDPMAIRLALLAHSHDAAWEWHDGDIEPAEDRLDRWRAAFARRTGAPASELVAQLRRTLRGGLDTAAALTAVDAWAAADGDDPRAPAAAATAVDALLGVV